MAIAPVTTAVAIAAVIVAALFVWRSSKPAPRWLHFSTLDLPSNRLMALLFSVALQLIVAVATHVVLRLTL